MNTPRFSHSAVALRDGEVLVTGGQQFFGASATSTAEIYNPVTGVWRYTKSPMSVSRYSHSATRLLDGRVLIAGGDNAAIKLSTAEIFDPVTETFSPTGSMASAHSLAAGVLMNDGRVFLVGRDWNPSCEIYQPVSGTWSTAAPLPYGVVGSAVTVLADGNVMVAGGADSSYATRNSIFVYSPASNSWRTLSPMLTPRQAFTATLLENGKVLFTGGSDIASGSGYASAELYDVGANGGLGQSVPTTSLASPRRGHTAERLPTGDVLVTGGTNIGVGSLNAAEVYRADSGTWSAAGSMVVGREAHSMTAVTLGRMLVAGGITHDPSFTNPTFQQTAEIWDPGCSTVQIDIRPGASPNTINLGSNGTIPVAILSTTSFAATGVNPLSITLAGATVKLKGQGTPQYLIQDANGDGIADLVVHILTDALQLSASDTEAVLRGATFGGTCIVGRDTVRVVP